MEPPVPPSVQTSDLNKLRRLIEAGNIEEVEETIQSNPRYLLTVYDSAVYMMAGPKYNACHIAARANKPDMILLILETVTSTEYVRKMYPNESDENIVNRIKHIKDSYLNTPDPRQGNTPMHFACKFGHEKVVEALLAFGGCDLTRRDSNCRTAEESICVQMGCNRDEDEEEAKKRLKQIEANIKKIFKRQRHCLPSYRDRIKKKFIMERRRSQASSMNDTTFSDLDSSFAKSLVINDD